MRTAFEEAEKREGRKVKEVGRTWTLPVTRKSKVRGMTAMVVWLWRTWSTFRLRAEDQR